MAEFLENYMYAIFLVLLLGIIVFCGICCFVIFLIKCGVKNAIDETLCSKEFREQLRNDISLAIISAHRQENSMNLENSIDE